MNYKYKKDDKGLHIFLAVTAVICFLLASSVFPFLFDSGAKPVPDILLCFVCTLTAFTDIKKASIYALSLGFCADLFINPPTALSPVIFLICMCIATACRRYFSRTGTLVIAICTIPCSFIKYIISCVVSVLTVEGAGVMRAALSQIPLGLVSDLACAIALAFIMRFIAKKSRLGTNN